MQLIPFTLHKTNALISEWHRHHQPVRGCRFTLACLHEEQIVGAVVVGRPVSREVDQDMVAEVTRLVTNGTENACSFLYGAAARVSKQMGFEYIQTYILDSELGTSLKASGWVFDGMTKGRDWNVLNRGGRRTDQPMVDKQRWVKRFR